MFMIMNYHILLNGSWMTVHDTNSTNLFLSRLIVEFSVISVNLFAMISGYVGVGSHHRYSRILGLWGQVLFFSWISLIFFLITMPQKLNTDFILKGMFPSIFKSYWYWNGYILLFILMPIINKGMLNIGKKAVNKLLIILLILSSVITVTPAYDFFNLSMGYSGLWLIILYILGFYFRKFGIPHFLKNMMVNLTLIIITWSILVVLSYVFHNNGILLDRNGLTITEFEYNFSLITLLSIFAFTFFVRIKVNSDKIRKIITFLGKNSFSAYLLQTNPLVFSFMVTNKYLFLNKIDNPLHFLGLLILFSMCWYFSAILIEVIRQIVFKPFKILLTKIS